MLDIESKIKGKRVMCLKKFIEDYPSSWKTIFDKMMSRIGGRFILYCNFDIAKLRVPYQRITTNVLMLVRVKQHNA